MIKITKRQYANLVLQINELEAKLADAKVRFDDAARQGDLRENAEFDQAKLDIQMISKKLENKRLLLQNVDDSTDTVTNSKIVFELDGERMEKTIDPEGIGEYETSITDTSIVGKAIKGAAPGDIIEYKDVNGNPHTIKVLRVM